MKNGKKMLSLCMAAAMAAGLTACGSAGSTDAASSAAASKAGGSYDKIVYAYSTFNNIPSAEDLDSVEEAINKITRDKIGVEVTLMPIGITDYSSKVALALQGGEQIDIFESLGNYNSCISTDMAYDLTDILDKDAADTKALIGDVWLQACSKNGKI